MFSSDRTFVICEQSQTHEGDLGLAKLLIKAAAVAQADAVKFQTFTADELAVPSYKYYPLFKKLEWSTPQWKELIDESHRCGLKAMADVFGGASAQMLTSIGIDALKIHATDIRNRPLLEELAGMDVPLLLSAGGSHIKEMKEALRVLGLKGKKGRPLVVMHGFQSYPTLIEHTNLLKMKLFGDALGLPYGFADHIDGNHHQKLSLCAMAMGMGACVIEKHITVSRILKMEDYESALDPTDFVEFVAKVRELDQAKGIAVDELIPVEENYRKATRKHVTATRGISKGDMISAKDVALKRSHTEFLPADIDQIIGRRMVRDVEVNEVVSQHDVL